MTTFKNFGIKLATSVIALGIGASGAFAAVGHRIDVTLPQAVEVNGATLPSGSYEVSEIPFAGMQSAFVFRDDTGHAAAIIQGDKFVAPPDADSSGASTKTEIILSPDEGGKMHLNSMFVEGDLAGYHFWNMK